MGKFREVRTQSEIYPMLVQFTFQSLLLSWPSNRQLETGSEDKHGHLCHGDRGQRRCDAKRKRHKLRETTDKKWSERRSEDNKRRVLGHKKLST